MWVDIRGGVGGVHFVAESCFSIIFVFREPPTLDDLNSAIRLEIELVTEETQERTWRSFEARIENCIVEDRSRFLT